MGAPKNSRGEVITAPTFMHASEQARLEGYELTCAVNEISILDIEVGVQMLVQGGQFWITGGKKGDRCQFAIIDKNNILGIHTLNNLVIGTPVEIVRYVKNYRVPEVSPWREDIIMPTVAPVANGLFLRVQYEATAVGGTRDMGMLFRWYINSTPSI